MYVPGSVEPLVTGSQRKPHTYNIENKCMLCKTVF